MKFCGFKEQLNIMEIEVVEEEEEIQIKRLRDEMLRKRGNLCYLVNE